MGLRNQVSSGYPVLFDMIASTHAFAHAHTHVYTYNRFMTAHTAWRETKTAEDDHWVYMYICIYL